MKTLHFAIWLAFSCLTTVAYAKTSTALPALDPDIRIAEITQPGLQALSSNTKPCDTA
jgi:hypothetical protein